MKAKHQRLALAIGALVAIGGASGLALSALREEADFFYAPSDVRTKGVEVGRAARLGGMVKEGSVRRLADGVTTSFVVTDGNATVPVRFAGITPDLFREGSGVVAEGRFTADGAFVADNLLAKHDEKYMPPAMAAAMQNNTAAPK